MTHTGILVLGVWESGKTPVNMYDACALWRTVSHIKQYANDDV